MDKVGDMILGSDPNNSTYYATASAFVKDEKNATTVQEVVSTAAAVINVKSIEDGIKSFAESSKVIMNALDSVSQIHPVISVVVLAFKAVITLELKRRSNDQKVIAIKLKMKDMVSVLLDLRSIKDPQQTAPDGTTIEGRMQDLMKRIAEDINKCGNACDTYTKKHVIVKVLKSPIWEGRLAEYGDLFDTHRKEIQFAISLHTTLGVEEANVKLENLGETLKSIEEGMNMLKLFRMLDSPGEKELLKIVERNGGAEAYLEDEKKLNDLASSKSCQLQNKQGVIDNVKLGEVKQSLKEDVDKSLNFNLTIFQKKLELQITQFTLAMDHTVRRETDRVISVITSGPHDRVVDKVGHQQTPLRHGSPIVQDLHLIWKEMVSPR
ncbi:hypothetical protein FRC19_007457 [Serendipita sp. 401]|nr:hypothetical protein FRC19_007457 [Serendipita sp. 401]